MFIVSNRFLVIIAVSNQGLNGFTNRLSLNVYLTDWPRYISFTGSGDTSDRTEIIENTEFVNRTCESDCNPNCNYTWINSTDSNVVSYT